jgi:tetratricopeptide (TPR) repeat protein
MSSAIKWLDLLGWTEEEMNDLRFVAYSYIKQGHYKTALKFFEALAVLCPHSAYDLQTLGALYLETGDNLTALNYLDRSLQIEANHPPTLLNRAKALLLLGYHKQGIGAALQLQTHTDPKIRGQAEALILSYT